MITLGIETSCDETALALIETSSPAIGAVGAGGSIECRVIGSLVHSQAALHSAYGGVFPTLAKREHGKNIAALLHKLLIGSEAAITKCDSRISDQAFSQAVAKFKEELNGQNPELIDSLADADFLKDVPPIDRIAVTEGPGLEPALWVGISFAEFLSKLWSIPLVPVNHMEGHIVGSLLESDIASGRSEKLKEPPLPSIALLISGGHTELVKIEAGMAGKTRKASKAGAENSGHFAYTIIGQTKDDAVGEAFDKAARLLGLPYPGGPHLSKMAEEARQAGIKPSVRLPRPMMKSGDLDFSFSGLKTAVLYAIRDAEKDALEKNTVNEEKSAVGLNEDFKKGLALEFETAVTETLEAKLRSGIEKIGARSIIIGGGVSANHTLRASFKKTVGEYSIPLFLPTHHISGDNALMIALAGALDNAKARSGKLRANGTKRLGSFT